MPGKADNTDGREQGGDPEAQPALSAVAKDVTLSQYAQMWMSGQDVLFGGADALGGPSDPYSQSLWYNRCVAKKATNAARVPIRLSRGAASGTRAVWDAKHVRAGLAGERAACRHKSALKAADGEIVETGDLYDLLNQPNPDQRWNEFLEATVTCLDNDGRVHWLFDEMVGRRPVSMYVFSGRDSKAIVDKSGRVPRLKGWTFKGADGEKFVATLDEVVTFQIYNPRDRFGGLAPRVPGRLAIVSDYNASLFNAAMFANSCEPGTVLETEAPFEAVLDGQMRTSWQQRHAGPTNARKLAILWGGLKHKSVGQTLREMVYPDGKRLAREEICALLDVPPSVAGFMGATGKSDAYTQNELKRFWQDTLTPLLDKFGDAVNLEICPRFPGGLSAWFDMQDVPIFGELRRAEIKTVGEMFRLGVPLADLNRWCDLGLPERPWYDVGMLPTGLMPAHLVASGELFGPAGEPAPPDDADDLGQGDDDRGAAGLSKALADRIWADWARSWAPLTRSLRHFLRTRYHAQQRRVIARLTALYGAVDDPSKAAKDDGIVAHILLEVSGPSKETAMFRARISSFVSDAGELGVRQALTEAGLTGEALEQAAGRLLSDPTILAEFHSEAVKVSSLIDTRTRRVLKRTLSEGISAGEDIRRLTDRVQGVMQNSRQAATATARNAVGQTLSRSRYRGQVAAGMTHKVWLHSRGPGERRPGHVAAEGRYAREPAIIDQPFVINGAALMYPRDHSAGRPGETVNCQCLHLARRLPAGRPARAADVIQPYLARGFVSYGQILAARDAATDLTQAAAAADTEGDAGNGE